MLQHTPIDLDALTEQLLDDTLETSSDEVRKECWARMNRIVRKIANILDESTPYGNGHLIDTRDIVDIFRYDSANYLSFEKFQSAVTSCLDIVGNMVSPDRVGWLMGEIAFFQRLISNNISAQYARRDFDMVTRQWSITQIVSDALLYSNDPRKALTQMFHTLQRIVRRFLPEQVSEGEKLMTNSSY